MTGDRRRRQDGMTLVELLVVLVVGGVLTTISLSALASGRDTLTRAQDDAQGQADVAGVVQRLSADLRQARRVEPGSAPGMLVLWVDRDGDEVRSAAEAVTWQVMSPPAGRRHFRLARLDGAGRHTDEARTLVSPDVFTFDSADPARVRSVGVDLRYDALPDGHLGEKRVSLRIRLRNAP